MNLLTLTICRNSAWTIEAAIRASLRWSDGAVVLDHASDDETPMILAELSGNDPRITVIREDNPVWDEMQHRQRTLDVARELGATHCAIVDDDEILTENMVAGIRDVIDRLRPAELILLPWVTLWRTLDKARYDGKWSKQGKAFAFKDHPSLYWHAKDGYQHHHTHPYGSDITRHGSIKLGGLMHYQHASWRRLMAKQTWYQMVEMVRWPEQGAEAIKARYAGTIDETGIKTAWVPAGWWGREKNLIRLDEEPWQERDMRRMIEQHGADYFKDILA